jgi:hypothetical protein
MIKGGKQDEALKEFCHKKGFEPHETGQMFRRNSFEPWILYRKGTKHPQKMKAAKEPFPGWTFSKSPGNRKEQKDYKCVCLHGAAYDGIEEAVWFVAKGRFEGYISKIKAKRLYVPWNPKRSIFDPARRELINRLRQNPVFDK